MDSTPMSHQLAVLYAFSCSADIWSNLTTEGSGYHLQAQHTRAGEMCMNSDVICSTHNSVRKAQLPTALFLTFGKNSDMICTTYNRIWREGGKRFGMRDCPKGGHSDF